MLTHRNIWKAIDSLAESQGITPSALARRAGLDSSAFNKSKRVSELGKMRWPSTESLAKVLEATGSSFGDLAALLEAESETVETTAAAKAQRVPVIGIAQASAEGFFDDAGHPVGSGWDVIEFPEVVDPSLYALEISGDSMEPVFRDGDRILVSPSSVVRRGDRVVVKTRKGEVMAKVLSRKTATKVELTSFNPAYSPRDLHWTELEWIARIVWASQ